jgi:trimeric autotransporter adhesin
MNSNTGDGLEKLWYLRRTKMLQRKIFSVVPAIFLALGAWPATAQTIKTFAGDGTSGYSGEGAEAVNSALNNPKGVAIDPAGNVYIADSENFRVRKVNTAGLISTYAGNGVNAFSGDGGQAVNASISDILSVALDPAGNLYIADSSNRRIRKVAPGGTITTVAGTGVQGYTGDGGQAISATLGRPVAVTLDVAGNLYYVDSVDQCVRRIDTNGIISTVAGNGVQAFSGDGGLAVSASLAFPLGIALDSKGNMYVADANNNRIRMINSSGIISTVAGGANGGFSGDGGLAVSASLNIPSDVAVDSAGNLYIADAGNNRIREVNPAGVISTIAGTTGNGFS